MRQGVSKETRQALAAKLGPRGGERSHQRSAAVPPAQQGGQQGQQGGGSSKQERRRVRGQSRRTDADVLVQDFVGSHDRGQVEQRLPHAHEHHVRHALRRVGGWVGEG